MAPPRVVRQQNSANLVWIDLEMTGLDPQHDAIVQAALVVTTATLEPLEEFVCDVWQPPYVLERMSPYVRQMHERTGLLKRLDASTTDVSSAEKQLIERVTGWCTYPAVLCGNSIGQDKRFIDRYMPGLSGYLSYRTVDVSSIKVLARLWYGEAGSFAKPTDGEHDALFDVRQSIAELAFYRDKLFRAEGLRT
ncbi:MAG TPA: oligoribonuclease [Polyangiaceae bacterium]|nr:oligoribonuclease [Polyangiaceae bacterium]